MKPIHMIFLSNYFNHHQQPFSEAMYERLGERFLFVETSGVPKFRKELGYGIEQMPPYVVTQSMLRANIEWYKQLINQADIVVVGSAPEQLVQMRIADEKLTFRYSERPLKNGFELWKYPVRLIRWRRLHPQKKNVYMLCASAYTALDYGIFGLYWNRCFKWGYFPKTEQYADIANLIAAKNNKSIIWVARYIDWKHPEIAIEIASRLKQDGYSFELNMIGNGILMEQTMAEVERLGLGDVVRILGAMKPEEVRRHMEQAQIHIFTSDRNEGWGAVLNESMNSCCVPVANQAIGSVPFLIEDGKNGYSYRTVDELYEKVKYLFDHEQVRIGLAKAAYSTIQSEWNAEIAAERLLELSECILRGEKTPFLTGPCSKAE